MVIGYSSRRNTYTSLILASLRIKGTSPFPAQNMKSQRRKSFHFLPTPPARRHRPTDSAPSPHSYTALSTSGCWQLQLASPSIPCSGPPRPARAFWNPVFTILPVCVEIALESPLLCLCSYVCRLLHHNNSNRPSLLSRQGKVCLDKWLGSFPERGVVTCNFKIMSVD